MRKYILALLVVVAACAVFAGTAGASTKSNWPNAQLDSAASSVAGHPVTVWCEDSWGDWIHAGDHYSEDWSYLLGFTFISQPEIFVNPQVCETLHALVSGLDVGAYHASQAILTLAHESVHQRGISDESVTDCTAYPLVPGLAANFFGVPRTVNEKRIVSYTKAVVKRANGRTVKVKVRAQKVVWKAVANPYLNLLGAYAQAWHKSAPAAYQGAC